MALDWKRVLVHLEIRNRIIGGIPANPKLIEGWIGANMPALAEEEKKKLAEKTVSELPAAAEEKAGGMWTTFKQDKTGVYIEGRQLKAMFKESANILREMLIKQEQKGKAETDKSKNRFTNLKAKLAERLFVEEDIVYLTREQKPLPKVDGNEEKPIHIMTAQGPRTALKRYDFVNAPASVIFKVRWLNDGTVDESLLKDLLDHSSWNGLGADRSQGNGLFSVQSIDPIQ